MPKIGRNEPCPCGSGKKYKNCCLNQEQNKAPVRPEEQLATQTAIHWLADNYGQQAFDAIEATFFADHEHDAAEAVSRMPEPLQHMLQININEWLLTDAALIIDNQKVRTVDLILGPKGPLLTARGRQHLITLASSPLSLYEIQEVHQGTGVRVLDLLDKALPPFFVHEVSATAHLVQWDIIGARCIMQNDIWSFTGALYPLPREEASRCHDYIQKKLKGMRGETAARAIRTQAIISQWVNDIMTPPTMPILIDKQTSELILYTTDNYMVSDWQTLEAMLLDQGDVIMEEEGIVWVHAEDIDEESYRTLARLERVIKRDKLRVECDTRKKADDARQWLEGFAGHLVQHTSRKSLTPSQMLRSHEKKQPSKPQQAETIPIEIQHQIMHDYLIRHYEEWPSTPLPALNGKTPFEAAKMKTLRPKLVDLLKRIDQLEARRAKEKGMQVVDTSFLWERLNIEKL